MKHLIVALALAAAASPALAVEPARAGEGPQFGLGIAIVPYGGVNSLPTAEIYVPLNLAPGLRIEPSLGIQTHDAAGNGTDTRSVTFGVGGFMTLLKPAPTVDFYAGGRLKLNFAKSKNPAGSTTGTDVSLAGAAGGEWFPVPKFSFGIEAQLGYYNLSEASGAEGDGFFTAGLTFLRVYF